MWRCGLTGGGGRLGCRHNGGAAAGAARLRRRSRRYCSRLSFAVGSNARQRRADRHLALELDQDLLDLAGLEDFDLDRAFLGLDHGDDVAALDPIAGLDQPFDQRAGFHVGAERGHAELDHGALLCPSQRGLGGRDDLGRLRDRGVFQMARIGDRHLLAADAADRRIE